MEKHNFPSNVSDIRIGPLGEILRGVSTANVRTVERAVDAINEHDIDSYFDCCTGDVELRTPVTPIEGAYQGAAGIRQFFSDVEAAGPNFHIEIEGTESEAERTLRM